jgi:hypothetical protein
MQFSYATVRGGKVFQIGRRHERLMSLISTQEKAGTCRRQQVPSLEESPCPPSLSQYKIEYFPTMFQILL